VTCMDVRVDRSPFGRGVFAARPFAPGEKILAVTGDRIDARRLNVYGWTWEAWERYAEPIQTHRYEYTDPDPPGRYVNHSCEPNAGLTPGLILIALAGIGEGEEIFIDYSTTMDEDGLWTMECGCATPSCRGTVEDFWRLPAALRYQYIEAGVVQEFIARKHTPPPCCRGG